MNLKWSTEMWQCVSPQHRGVWTESTHTWIVGDILFAGWTLHLQNGGTAQFGRLCQSLLELSEKWDWKWGMAWGLGEIVSPASSPHASCVSRMAPTHPGTLRSSTKWLILLSTLQIEVISYTGFASNVFLLNKRQIPLLICLEVNLKNEVKYKSK